MNAATDDFAAAEQRIAMALAEAGFPGCPVALRDDGDGVRVHGVEHIPGQVAWKAIELARLGNRTPLCWECSDFGARPWTGYRAREFCRAVAPLTQDCGVERRVSFFRSEAVS